jgi:hypothetical protein
MTNAPRGRCRCAWGPNDQSIAITAANGEVLEVAKNVPKQAEVNGVVLRLVDDH